MQCMLITWPIGHSHKGAPFDPQKSLHTSESKTSSHKDICNVSFCTQSGAELELSFDWTVFNGAQISHVVATFRTKSGSLQTKKNQDQNTLNNDRREKIKNPL